MMLLLLLHAHVDQLAQWLALQGASMPHTVQPVSVQVAW
jgi:hypothetical protein